MSITSRSPMNCQSFSLGPRWHLPWRGSVPRRLEKQRKPGESARGRSNGVSKRLKRPIESGPSGIGRVLSPLVRAPSGTSKTSRSLLLAVSRSTINKPSEYMKLNNSAFAITASFVKPLHNLLNRPRDQNQIRDSAVSGARCRLRHS